MPASANHERVFQIAAASLLVLVIAGALFEQIGERQDRRRYAQIGKSYDMGGRTLNIFCSGDGGPAVVFDTFGHTAGYSWSPIQMEVAKFRRACWYDRAGYGWSDPAPMPRTFQSVAADLHALLRAASVPPPYVLVGGGDAASHIRVYHGMYPGEVAGIVMVNANGTDDDSVAIPEEVKGPWAKHFASFAPRVRGTACLAFPLIAKVGLVRFASLFQKPRATPNSGMPPDEQAELDFLSDNPTAARGSEMCARETSMEEVRSAGNLGDVPLMVLASAERFAGTSADGVAWSRYQENRVQPGLAKLSTRGRLIFIEGEMGPDKIVQAIREVAASQ